MRHWIFIISYFAYISFAYGQSLTDPGRSTENQGLNSAFELFFKDPNNVRNQSELKSQLSNIPFQSMGIYSDKIDSTYFILKKDLKKNTDLYIEILRIYSLNLYNNKRYEEATRYFKMFFESYDALKDNTFKYAFEYSLYTNSYYKLKDYQTFLNLSRDGVKRDLAKPEKNIDICYIYLNFVKYYNIFRVPDSSRYYADLTLTLYQKFDEKDYKILSEIYKQKGIIESVSENHKLVKIYFDKAIEYLLLTDHSEIDLAIAYNYIGISYLASNQLENAIKYLKLVIHIYEKELPNSSSLGNKYYNLGMAYSLLEDYQNALLYFNKSLEINPNISNYFTHRYIANTYYSLDSIELARKKYVEVLDYLKMHENEQSYQIAFTELSYGQLLVEKTNDHILGEKVLSDCINRYYHHFKGIDHNLVIPLNILGSHYINTGQIDRGLDSLQKALSISAIGFKYNNFYENPEYDLIDNTIFSNNTLAWKAYGLYLRFVNTQSTNDLIASQKTYDFYIYCTSENRKYFDNPSNIVTSSQVHYVYNQAINVSYLLYSKTGDQQYLNDIFKFIEGKKSFTLFQSLKILEQKKLLNIPKELLKKEEDLKYQISLLTEKIKAEEKGKNRLDEIKNLREKEFRIELKLDSLQNIFKNEYSSFYELKYGFKELTIDEIKERITEKTAFVNYSISDSLLHTIAFTKDTVYLVSKTIDSVFFNDIETVVRLLNKVNTDNSYNEFLDFSESSYRLYLNLISPVEKTLNDKQIVFIPDDELNYISFDALIQQPASTDRPDYRTLHYLIKDYKTNIANSMQIYFNMKKRLRNPNNKVYAFAPFYPQSPNPDSIPDEYKDLRPLDYAELEVENISRSISTNAFIGYEATKDTFRQIAKDAGILHLAMHTIINDNKPLQSKFLFTYNPKSSSSMLNTYELLALELNAELAVLSGCSTGDGKLQKGEGVMSLSSGFQYAGVPAVVMSLWEVNDRFGSLVIHKFYENLANGFDKKQALYDAKKDVLSQGNALYAHPYYWAGLTLIGDETKINFIRRYQWDKLIIVFSPILFIIVVLFQTRKKWLIKKT